MTKTKLALLVLIPFILGFVIVSMALMAGSNDAWLKGLESRPHTRVILVDPTQDETVTIFDFYGNEVRLTNEP
jgi:hypothetical protein